jgi:hypothetical protein
MFFSINLQEQLARADALKAEGNAAFAEGDMEQAIVSLKFFYSFPAVLIFFF